MIICLFVGHMTLNAYEYSHDYHKFRLTIPDYYSVVDDGTLNSQYGWIAKFERNSNEVFCVYAIEVQDNQMIDKKKFLNFTDETLMSMTNFKEWDVISETKGKGYEKAKIYKVDNDLYFKVYLNFVDGWNGYIYYATAPSPDGFIDADDIAKSFSRKSFWIFILKLLITIIPGAFLFNKTKDYWRIDWVKFFTYSILILLALIAAFLLLDLPMIWILAAILAGYFDITP